MAAHWFWWILAALLVGAELLTGTFYLLAVGVAFAVGGLVALARSPRPEVQLGVAAVVARRRGLSSRIAGAVAHAAPAPVAIPLIGQSVRVQAWNADGTARVAYRGSRVDRRALDTRCAPRGDVMFIVGARGSTLLIQPAGPGHYGRLTLPFPRRSRAMVQFGASPRSTFLIFLVALIVVVKAIRVVPQQQALGPRAARAGRCGAAAGPQLRDSVR